MPNDIFLGEEMDINNKVAVITGGAQGFGLDIARRFLDSGAKVIIWDIDTKLIDEAMKEISNPNLSSDIVDVSDYKEVENCINEIELFLKETRAQK